MLGIGHTGESWGGGLVCSFSLSVYSVIIHKAMSKKVNNIKNLFIQSCS